MMGNIKKFSFCVRELGTFRELFVTSSRGKTAILGTNWNCVLKNSSQFPMDAARVCTHKGGKMVKMLGFL